MKLLIRVAAILMLVSISGCDKDDKPVKAADTGLLKTQLETLEQAKQVEQAGSGCGGATASKNRGGNAII